LIFRDGFVTACRRALHGFRGQSLGLSPLETKALWILAVEGSRRAPDEVRRDNKLSCAGETAITKVWLLYLRNPPSRAAQ
jgi:hypothetical protein